MKNTFSSFFLRPEISFCSLLACLVVNTSLAANPVEKISDSDNVFARVTHTGGVRPKSVLCPSSPFDSIVKIEALNPPPKPNQPVMTTDGIYQFIQQQNITTIEQLLGSFPDHYRNNFSLVETTRATGQSNLAYPRIVLFGPDGRFLLNVGSKADDPKYKLLDVAELHEDTGNWEFSVFDFSKEKPTVMRHDASCYECHGDKNARPIWGTVLEWTGVFGDNIAPGPQGEALDGKHLERINQIKSGQGDSPRFDFLVWTDEKLHRGGKRKIANHAFGPELLLSNIAMGSATSRGTYLRLTKNFPKQYKTLREELLLSYYLKKGNAYVDKKQIKALEKIKKRYKLKDYDLDSLLAFLGVDTKEAFSVATIASKESPKVDWGMGKGDLYDMLMLQVLDELQKDNPEIANILKGRQMEEGILDCPGTAPSIADVVDFKMFHLFHLKGDARYQVNKVFYPLDLEDIYDRVFIPISSKVIPYLKNNIAL
jgi:hypothetical protein